MMISEHRRAPRFDTEWPVRVRLAGGQWVRGRAINVSTSGLLFSVSVELAADSYVDLEIGTQRLETVSCRVHVLREAGPAMTWRRYAAEFVEMRREDCLLLAQRLMALPQPCLR